MEYRLAQRILLDQISRNFFSTVSCHLCKHLMIRADVDVIQPQASPHPILASCLVRRFRETAIPPIVVFLVVYHQGVMVLK